MPFGILRLAVRGSGLAVTTAMHLRSMIVATRSTRPIMATGPRGGGQIMPAQYARPFSEIQVLPDRLIWPLRQKKPLRIFVNSVSDLFHSQIADEHIFAAFEVMRQAYWHTFQILTKRPGRLRKMASQLTWSRNIGIGVSIERDELTPRADALRPLPAGFRFLSLGVIRFA